MMKKIVLTTINARFSHASLGLRWLLANLGQYKAQAAIQEFTLTQRPIDMAEELLKHQASIIGLGIYIWNIELMEKLIPLLKRLSPTTILVAGGPEISHLYQQSSIYEYLDHIIVGEGEHAFHDLCQHYLGNKRPGPSPAKVVNTPLPDLATLQFPYDDFSDEDIENRNISVEASRGCPFGCHFCLSSLDSKVRFFPPEAFLNQLQKLWDRGVRKFKFIDRTFNLPKGNPEKILQFFLQKDEEYFLHFEMIPDHFPDSLKELITKFPPKSLQFEIGIQSFNPEVAARIGRHQNYEKIEENLRLLSTIKSVHLHVDLIMGLPGESYESIGKGIDRLYLLNRGEIQLGILKKLKGAPIAQHDQDFKMIYDLQAPYEILKSSTLTFEQLMELKRLARFWDLIINSGNFCETEKLIINQSAFSSMIELSNWIFSTTQATHKISLERLAKLIATYLIEVKKFEAEKVRQCVDNDLVQTGQKPIFNPSKYKELFHKSASGLKGIKRQEKH